VSSRAWNPHRTPTDPELLRWLEVREGRRDVLREMRELRGIAPTLYLGQVTAEANRRRRDTTRGAAQVLSGMALTPTWAKQSLTGLVEALQPSRHDLGQVRNGTITPEVYFRRYARNRDKLRQAGKLRLGPGDLDYRHVRAWSKQRPRDERLLYTRPVDHGDAITCVCAAWGSKARKHSCHLEEAAWWLVRAGWDVVLYGVRIYPSDLGPIRDDTGGPFMGLCTPDERVYEPGMFGLVH